MYDNPYAGEPVLGENEFRSLSGTTGKPIYDHTDDRCDQILRPRSTEHTGEVLEAMNAETMARCMADPELEYVGGIRYNTDDGTEYVYGYFWRLRSSDEDA